MREAVEVFNLGTGDFYVVDDMFGQRTVHEYKYWDEVPDEWIEEQRKKREQEQKEK